MTVAEAIIFGIVQGIAEFLPISSSGHLALGHNLFGAEESNYLPFDVLLHLATLVAVCLVYYRDVWLIIKGFFTLIKKLFTGRLFGKGLREKLNYGEKLFVMLLIATIPLIPISLLTDKVENIQKVTWIIGLLLIINGLMLYLADKMNTGNDDIKKSDLQKPFYIGLFQVIGILPGISRSGSTITGGLFFGFNRQDAVKFSFLMSIPAILGACVLELPDFFSTGISTEMIKPCVAGAISAVIIGFLAIKLLQYIAKNKSFGIFSIYCIFIGITAIAFDLLK